MHSTWVSNVADSTAQSLDLGSIEPVQFGANALFTPEDIAGAIRQLDTNLQNVLTSGDPRVVNLSVGGSPARYVLAHAPGLKDFETAQASFPDPAPLAAIVAEAEQAFASP